RLRDTNADGKADGEPVVWTHLRHPEHGANGLIRGPDGWFYLICGNDAGVSKKHAMTERSPVLDPQCGAVVRFSPDGKKSEVFAHGFRNPYDIAFDANGHLFTFEADGERDQHLPWYAPCRVFDIAQGMHHGWVLSGWKRSWNRPQSYFDNVERMIEVGRGSPTGVAVYRHTTFPKKYHNGLLFACWSLGKIYFAPLTRSGSTYKTTHETFVETTGDVGFAPVDIAVGPEGDLFIAIGGRGTRGSVFRVRYVGKQKSTPQKKASVDKLTAVLRAPQPQASWSRAKWVPVAKSLGRKAFVTALNDQERQEAERIRALEILVDQFGGFDSKRDFKAAPNMQGDELQARIVWAIGRSKRPDTRALINTAQGSNLLASRYAWEGLQTVPGFAEKTRSEAWPGGLLSNSGNTDRRVFAARALAIGRKLEPKWLRDRAMIRDRSYLYSFGLFGHLRVEFVQSALAELQSADEIRAKLRAVRLAQLCLHDISAAPAKPEVHAGYLPNGTPKLTEFQQDEFQKTALLFPTGDEELDRELARLLGMVRIEDKKLLARVASKWTAKSAVTDDVHYLIVMSLLRGHRSANITQKTAAALCDLHHKMTAAKMYPSRNWPRRVGEAFVELMKHDPKLAQAVVDCGLFGHAEHLMFVRHLMTDLRPDAVRKILAANEDAEDPWPIELVALVDTLPKKEALPALRDQWEQPALRDAIARVLARHGDAKDRSRLVQALRSADPGVVENAARALQGIERTRNADELTQVFIALRRHLGDKRQQAAREALASLLAAWTDDGPKFKEPADQTKVAAAYTPWFEWFAKHYPKQSQALAGGVSAGDWQKRITRINFDAGDAMRGAKIFARQQCSACHTGRSRLGPDLAGVGGRFATRDLLLAIVEPDRDVSPTYQATMIETGAGKTYHGIIVYGSPDATLIQTSATETLRIAGPEIVSIRKSPRSLMPAGLLDGATDDEVADLVAYLKTLRK
ncbi:MAG: c-type cytochrome, partial [Pirellulales bacterium]|nr:c-type cytochrome [Pirellulales bacterium]